MTLQSISKEVNLPVEEESIWFNHLRTVLKNRQRGARKAAETRRQQRQLAGHAKQVSITSESEKITTVREDEEQRGENQDIEQKTSKGSK